MAIGEIYTGLRIAEMVAKYLGVVETIERKVDKLMRSDLETAKSLFQQAVMVENPEEQLDVIRTARTYFTKASTLEEGVRKGVALAGVAACYCAIDEKNLMRDHLLKVLEVVPYSKGKYQLAVSKVMESDRYHLWTLYLFKKNDEPNGWNPLNWFGEGRARVEDRIIRSAIKSTKGGIEFVKIQYELMEFLGVSHREVERFNRLTK